MKRRTFLSSVAALVSGTVLCRAPETAAAPVVDEVVPLCLPQGLWECRVVASDCIKVGDLLFTDRDGILTKRDTGAPVGFARSEPSPTDDWVLVVL